MATRTKQSIADLAARAARGTATMIPPRVFVPLGLRRSKLRIVGYRTTVAPPTQDEDEIAIAAADPTAFLIAVMQGQPIPAFKLTEKEDGSVDVDVVFDVPDMQTRANVALALSRRVKKPDTKDTDYEAAMRRAADQAGDE